MTTDTGRPWHSNPFPSTPVVRLDSSVDLGDARVPAADSGNVTVPTRTLEELDRLSKEYFAEPAVGGRRGRAVAVVGDFGLGKSHALREVYAELSARQDAPALWIVDEPDRNMGWMYRDRLRGPGATEAGRRAFEEIVRNYYAYVTARRVGEQGEDARFGDLGELADRLREGSLDPGKVVAALRYDPEVIHTDLRQKLSEVTEHRSFATALALLPTPEFTRMVWAWLGGDEPAQPLRERGITQPIGVAAGDERGESAGIHRVFDALAVQGFVHGRVGRPYVLLMDSLEKVLDWPDATRRTFVDAFERLVNIYVSRGGLMIFSVSPEGLSAFRPSLHERVVQVWPTGFDESLTNELVTKYVMAGRGTVDDDPPPPPFGAQTLELLHRLTEGVPRQVLETCHQAWQLSEDERGAVREVTAATVLRAVRALHEKVSRERVLAGVRAALGRGQWRIASRDPVPERLSSPEGSTQEVLYWLAPAANAYLAVILTPSVLVAADVEQVTAHVHALRTAVNPARLEVLLVVNGHLSHAMQDRLSRTIGSRPLVYRQTGFVRAAYEALEALGGRLREGRREADLADLGDRMRREFEAQRRQFAELREEWTVRREPLSPDPVRPDGVAEPAEPPDLPEPVRHRFREALSVLDTVSRRLTDKVARPRRTTGTDRELGQELGRLGCATLVRMLTEDFRAAVAAWCRVRRARVPSDEQWAELRRICRDYETSVEVLPVHLLGGAGPAHPLTAARTVEVLAEEVWGTLSAAPAP
ncbi:hypothetical protein [Streptomyces sp. VRA16 Mangrove soil]|uniref:hypothetical protein n=1 Tax=Streptomyces sp. VRA16 Mangrove soil TaxID=2817434 RepID=UPI001A9E907C|nr:hypothetical protein [Streptomyces sp. VRA16 Mangrove soil]MBO1330019.1 hypothetical protein [Streptomyces sp. VRA16 Mangrove soil]